MSHRLLLVDDDDAMRRLFTRILERAGMTVFSYGSAEEALVASESFTALVTDIDLPGKNGVELAEAFRQERPSLPVVFITGGCAFSLAQRAKDTGLLLEKPVDPGQLVAAIEEVMG